MIDEFTVAGILHQPPAERTAKNGNRFLTAVLICSRQMATERQRQGNAGKYAEMVEVTVYDQTCMDLLRQCRPGDFVACTGYIHSHQYRRADGSEAWLTTLIVANLSRLDARSHE
ncbi:single-stranded DNA-binding protein [Faecalibaculum rodentium]|jgi:single-stranded DNA-binding protein|uniref:Single-stranded DNA-binding protein n=1 Tax=Faecalibaculum rodentium TaxID=1702221 RepID=A0A1Q9YLG2_9FIRM|nr:single-stranded DNA-binding protein [Faecalibaculum rodentium]OLU45735.1 hypothetical protein BO223_04390 [Faecalibaculum rodentium]